MNTAQKWIVAVAGAIMIGLMVRPMHAIYIDGQQIATVRLWLFEDKGDAKVLLGELVVSLAIVAVAAGVGCLLGSKRSA